MAGPSSGSLGVLAVVLVLAATAPAAAHAVPVEVSPPHGARLAQAPLEIWAQLSQEAEASGSGLHVENMTGEAVRTGALRVDHGTRMSIALLDALPPGGYVVTWRTLSGVDGHVMEGRWAFLVGNATVPEAFAEGASREEPPAWGAGIVKAATLIGGMLVGGALVAAVLLRGAADAAARTRERVARVARVAATLLAMALVLWAARSLPLGSQAFSWTMHGVASAVGGLAAVPLLAGAWLVHRHRSAGWTLIAAGWLVGIASGGSAGHAAATTQAIAWGAALTIAHALAASTWLGGVALLALLLTRRDEESRAIVALGHRFGLVAAPAALSAIVTGALLAGLVVSPDPRGWFEGPYGRFLLAKVLLVGALLALGAFNHFALRRHRPGSGLRQGLRAEAVFAVALLCVTGLLTQTAPHAPVLAVASVEGGPELQPAPVPPLMVEADGSHHRVLLTVRPGPVAAEVSNWTARLLDLASNRAADDASSVVLEFEAPDRGLGPFEVRLSPSGAGRYAAEGAFLLDAGPWEVTVRLDTPRVAGERVAFGIEARAAS